MKKSIVRSVIYLITVFSLTNCGVKKATDPTPEVGSASANFNGTAWKSEYAGALTGGSGSTQLLTVVIQLTEKDNSEFVSIGVSPFTGTGTFNYGGSNKIVFNLKYKGKNYSAVQIGGNAGTGTIKITEFVDSKGILNPGKVVGEFSGTIKSTTSTEILTITNGKFTAIKVL